MRNTAHTYEVRPTMLQLALEADPPRPNSAALRPFPGRVPGHPISIHRASSALESRAFAPHDHLRRGECGALGVSQQPALQNPHQTCACADRQHHQAGLLPRRRLGAHSATVLLLPQPSGRKDNNVQSAQPGPSPASRSRYRLPHSANRSGSGDSRVKASASPRPLGDSALSEC